MHVENSNEIMHRIVLFVLFLTTLLISPVSAQKNNKTASQKVTEAERSQSSQFADALREYYADDHLSAEKSFRKILSLNERHAPSYYMLYKIKKEQKRYNDAISYLNEALKIDSKNSWYKEELATTYDLVESYDKSAKLWLALSKEKPTMEHYLFSLADAYLNLKKFEKVIRVYDKLEVIMGYNDEITEAKKNIWLYLNKVQKAANEYDRLIKEFPSEIKYYISAGNIYLTNDYPNKALPYFEKAAQINPQDVQLQIAFYDYYKTVGNKSAAYNALLNLIRNRDFPVEDKLGSVKSLFSAFMLNITGDNLSKKDMLEIVTTFTQYQPEVADGWSFLATLHLIDNKYEEGRAALEKVLALDVSRYTVWEDYFYVLSRLNDFKTLISKDESVHELFPTNAMLLYTLGVAYLNEKRPERASELFKEAMPFAFDNFLLAKIYYMLGNANFELNNEEEAVKNWKLAKKKGLNSQELIDKLSKYE